MVQFSSVESVGLRLGLCFLGHQNWEHWAFEIVLARECLTHLLFWLNLGGWKGALHKILLMERRKKFTFSFS